MEFHQLLCDLPIFWSCQEQYQSFPSQQCSAREHSCWQHPPCQLPVVLGETVVGRCQYEPHLKQLNDPLFIFQTNHTMQTTYFRTRSYPHWTMFLPVKAMRVFACLDDKKTTGQRKRINFFSLFQVPTVRSRSQGKQIVSVPANWRLQAPRVKATPATRLWYHWGQKYWLLTQYLSNGRFKRNIWTTDTIMDYYYYSLSMRLKIRRKNWN